MTKKILLFPIISIFLISFFIVSLFQFAGFSHAQSNDEPINILTKFEMTELSENNDILENVSSIQIPLPSENWNITSLDLNFTDIRLGKEIKPIEELGGENDIKTVSWKDYLGFGVQINITVPTIIFGVFIYGYQLGNPKLPVYVQIQGYDSLNYIPDENILGNTLINITDEGWHLNTFEDEVSLPPDQYYLVINGSELDSPFDKTEYNFI